MYVTKYRYTKFTFCIVESWLYDYALHIIIEIILRVNQAVGRFCMSIYFYYCFVIINIIRSIQLFYLYILMNIASELINCLINN